MKNSIKTTIAVLVFASMGVGASYASANLAASQTEAVKAANSKPVVLEPVRHHCKGNFLHQKFGWRLGFGHDKRLTSQDAAVITKAALLMHGRHNLDVGKITAKTGRRGQTVYVVQIVNKKKNAVVKTVIVNSRNGHIRPLRT